MLGKARFLLLWAALGLLGCGPASVSSAFLVPPTGVLLGAFVNTDSSSGWNAAAVMRFESEIGRRLDIDHSFHGFDEDFPVSAPVRWDIQTGRIPMISWGGSAFPGLIALLSGRYDAMLRLRARELKALRQPVFFRPMWEMNGSWFPWSGPRNNDRGTTDGAFKYRRAWQRIHDIFAAVGANNVAWVWCPNAADRPARSWNHWTNFYPGDRYVDWVCVDAYNWGNGANGGWRGFTQIISPLYRDYARRKPIMIGETASTERGGSKALWIERARSALRQEFPDVHAFVWFNRGENWRIDTSPCSLAAFQRLAADPYFNTRGGTLGGHHPVRSPGPVISGRIVNAGRELDG